MKSFGRIVSGLVIAAGACMLTPTLAQADAYKIDPVHSTSLFRIHHFKAGYILGLIAGPTGDINFDPADPSKLTITASASLDTLYTGNDRRDGDLKGADWFNAKQFPTIDFKSTSVSKIDDTHFAVAGDLTLHGVTKSVVVKFEMTGIGKGMHGETRMGMEGLVTIHREDFDMKTFPGAIGDDVQLTVEFESVQQ